MQVLALLLTILSSWGVCIADGFVSQPLSGNSQYVQGKTATSSLSIRVDSYLPEVSIRGKASRSLVKDLNTNIFNRLSFGWVKATMELGNKRPLEVADLWELDEASLMGNMSATFDALFEEAKQNANVSGRSLPPLTGGNVVTQFGSSPLIKAIVKMFEKELIRSGITKFFNTFVQFLPSLVVARILKNVDSQAAAVNNVALLQHVRSHGVWLSLLLLALLSAKTFLENQYFYTVIKMGANIRSTLSSAIYRKALKLSPSGRVDNTVGEMVNYMQTDTNRMEQVAGSIHTLWDGFFQVFGYVSLLLYYLGPSVFAGIAAMLVIIPLNAYFLKRLSKLRSANLSMTDERVKLTNEVFQGVRAIKSYSWEGPFVDQLVKIRAEEIRTLKACANVRAILVSMLSASPSIVSVVTLGLYALLGNTLTPVKVFTALALFNQLRFPLIFLPILLNNLTEGKLSLERLHKFFSADEVESYVERLPKEHPSKVAISITGGLFEWSRHDQPLEASSQTREESEGDDPNATSSKRGCLKDINLEVKEGELVAVVGPVGSGKSSLVSALLGEMHREAGRVSVKGAVAYVSQAAWIPNDSLKNVILFGSPMEQARYQSIIDSCGLRRDVEILESGDETEIGENAVTLSGGQKQRVNLARAVYEDADVYVLDDPLSALDSDVGARVFRDCVKGSLADKTRVMVTHQLNTLPEVDRVVLMDKNDDGTCFIADQGTFSELLARGHDLSKVVRASEEEANDKDSALSTKGDVPEVAVATTAVVSEKSDATVAPASQLPRATAVLEMSPIDQRTAPVSVAGTPPAPDANECVQEDKVTSPAPVATPVKLMTVEERAEGEVELSTYRSYLKAANKPALLVLILASFLAASASQQLQQVVVAAWTSDVGYVKRPLAAYLGGVTLMAAGVAFFNWSRTYVGAIYGAGASEALHSQMIRSVLRAPLFFFESTPVGRLVQRFTRDLDQIDQQLPGSFGQFVASSLNIISAMAAIAVVTPSFSIIIAPILIIYVSITNFYRQCARELKRLDSVTRSPIFSHFGETLGGLPLIRAFKREGLFRRTNEVRLEDSNAAYYALKVVDRWLSVRLELLGNAIVFLSALLVVLTKARAGSSGLSINNALGITGLLNWAVRNGAELESLMNSVERVNYTTQQTPHEATWGASPAQIAHENQGQATQDLTGWPWTGGIEFHNVFMRYREDFQQVLRGVSLSLRPGEVVGIVGRTGSGKSSLFRALLRLTELESGVITIDGVDVSTMDTSQLRSSVAIIPQDPVLFSGTIRTNLDPFSVVSDDALWDALERSNLGSTVRSLPGGLDCEVGEGGGNFSLGQRQLLCLARALLRKSRILLLDEATSSIDYQTDSIIQKTIKSEARQRGSTVITIAHRLDTVLESDRILVMDNGKVAEFASPEVLLAKKNSLLSLLVKAERNEAQKQKK